MQPRGDFPQYHEIGMAHAVDIALLHVAFNPVKQYRIAGRTISGAHRNDWLVTLRQPGLRHGMPAACNACSQQSSLRISANE